MKKLLRSTVPAFIALTMVLFLLAGKPAGFDEVVSKVPVYLNTTYSFEDAMHDYKLSLLHRLGALISTISVMPFTEEQIKMHVDVLLPRAVSAILDHDAGSALFHSQHNL